MFFGTVPTDAVHRCRQLRRFVTPISHAVSIRHVDRPGKRFPVKIVSEVYFVFFFFITKTYFFLSSGPFLLKLPTTTAIQVYPEFYSNSRTQKLCYLPNERLWTKSKGILVSPNLAGFPQQKESEYPSGSNIHIFVIHFKSLISSFLDVLD